MLLVDYDKMSNVYESYLKSLKRTQKERPQGRYKHKLAYLKQLIREYVHENAALLDEIEEVQIQTIMRQEERKFLLKKVCEYEPKILQDVQKAATKTSSNTNNSSPQNDSSKKRRSSSSKSRRSPSKLKKKLIRPIPRDNIGRPILPVELGRFRIHSLGEITSNKSFYTETVIYPVGYSITRVYGSIRDPTKKCIYTCRIMEENEAPRFEIASEEQRSPIIGDTPDICHSILLQRINDALCLNVVSTRPRGKEFFGLTHPNVLNLIQQIPGVKKCTSYKWIRFELSKTCEPYKEDSDPGLSYEHLQRSINFCKYKMAPDVLQKPDNYLDIF